MLRNKSDAAVAGWLLLCCGLVFAMVVLGGVTRLTGSGLSMVDWRPIIGVLPPITDAQWQEKFQLYQASPEFQQINFNMTLRGFKGIFWLEYLHRLLGRAIGVVFLGGFLIHLAAGRIRLRETPRYGLMFVLGGLQGLLGWYMVKSGLVDDPRVSPYRLSAHLAAAFVIYAYMFWVALDLLYRRIDGRRHRLYRHAVAMLLLIGVTVISGGFVAGLDAGLAFSTFPKMGDRWIPDALFALQPVWRNFFENVVTAQFDHRLLAMATLLTTVVFWIYARREFLPDRVRGWVALLPYVVLLQVALGIMTLVYGVPVALAAAHQATALLLFTVALFICHGMKGALR